MNKYEFRVLADYHLDQLQELIDTLTYHGDKPEVCQKVNLQVSLNNLSARVNGVEEEDFKPPKKQPSV